jgi:myosin heavy subunit
MVSGHGEMDGSINKFFKSLVAEHEEGQGADALKRGPSIKIKKKDLKADRKKTMISDATVSSIYRKELSEIMDALNETRTWFVVHVKAASQESSFDPEFIKAQVSIVDFKMLNANPASKFSSWLSMVDFDKRYGDSLNANLRVCNPACVLVPGESLKVSLNRALFEGKNWDKNQVAIGTTHVFMSEKVCGISLMLGVVRDGIHSQREPAANEYRV